MNGQALQLGQQADIEKQLAALRRGSGERCLADYSFANLWLFRAVHQYRYHAGELCGVSGKTYDAQTHFLPLFDITAVSPSLLQALIKQYGCLYPIAEEAAQQLPPNLFNLHCCADDVDYLYPVQQFQDYCGKALAKKRNLLHQFLAAYSARVERFNAAKHPSFILLCFSNWHASLRRPSSGLILNRIWATPGFAAANAPINRLPY